VVNPSAVNSTSASVLPAACTRTRTGPARPNVAGPLPSRLAVTTTLSMAAGTAAKTTSTPSGE